MRVIDRHGCRRTARGPALIAGVLAVGVVLLLLLRAGSGDADRAATQERRRAEDLPQEPLVPLPAPGTEPRVPVPLVGETPQDGEDAVPLPEPAPRETVLHPRVLQIAVVDSRGAPVSGASVTVTPSERAIGWEWAELVADAVDSGEPARLMAHMPVLLAKNLLHETSEPLTALSSTDGRATLALEHDYYVLQARHPDRGSSDRLDLADAALREITSLRLELRALAVLSGRVLGADGTPVADAQVTLDRDYGASHTAPAPVTTNAQGRFEMHVDTPYSADVWAQTGDGRSDSVHVRLEPGARERVELRLRGAFGIAGTVLGAEDAPVAGAEVAVLPTYRDGARCTTGADGSFRLPLASAGTILVGVGQHGDLVLAEPVTVVLTPEQPRAEDVVVRLVRGETISGTLVDAQGEPVRNFYVRSKPVAQGPPFENALDRMVKSDANGRFALPGIHGGFAHRLGGSRFLDDRVVEEIVVEAGARDVVLRLSTSEDERCTVTGRVVDAASGHPVPAFDISFGDWLDGVEETGIQRFDDVHGRFELALVTPWQQWLVVRAAGYPPATVGPLDLVPRGRLDVLVELPRAGSLRVRVVDGAGVPVDGALVVLGLPLTASHPGDFEKMVSARTAGGGLAAWEALAPGSHLIMAGSDARLSDAFIGHVPAGGACEVALVLADDLATAAVRVEVRDARGRPRVGAKVTAKERLAPTFAKAAVGGVLKCSAITDGGGAALLADLRPGQWWIWVHTGDAWLPPRTVPLPAGATATVVFEE